MAPRPIGPFLETPGNYGRRPRTMFWVFTVILLVVVVVTVFKIIPQGPVEIISDRQARKKLAEAEKLEGQSLNNTAAELYGNVVESTRVSNLLRVKAARGLARVSREMPGHAEAVAAALEKAYYFSPAGPDKDNLRDELEKYIGHPLNSVTPPGAAGAAITSGTAVSAPYPAQTQARQAQDQAPLPRESKPLARVNGETVGLDEIYNAWILFNGQRKPGTEEFKRFIKEYLDMILMSGEARHLGMDRTPEAVYEQHIHRIYFLSNALTKKLIKDLPSPDFKTLQDYYHAHQELFMTPAQAVLGRIVVSGKDKAAKVAKALDQGQRFDRVAAQYSLDAKELQKGYLLGRISQNDASVPEVAADPQFVGRLLALDVGMTTGPLASPRGTQWLHIVEKTPAKLRPFDDVQENVLFSYQKEQLTQSRTALLKQLRQDHPIEPVDPSMRKLLDLEPANDAGSTSATTAGAPATTATLAATTATLAGDAAPIKPDDSSDQ